MVGLSIVLEGQKSGSGSSSSTSVSKNKKVINKTTMIINNNNNNPSSSPSSSSNFSLYRSFSSVPTQTFLDQCFLCKQKLLPGKDIYMYKGDRGFCSVECRCRQIFMDEEESILQDNCSLAAMKPTSSSSSSSSGSRHRKGTTKTRAGGGFAC